MAVVMLGDGAMGGLVLCGSIWRNQDRRHHSQAAESSGDHVAHHVSVIVLTGPDEAALTPNDPGYGVVNEGVEIGEAQLPEPLLVICLKLLLEHPLEHPIVDLGDGILGGKPQILLCINGVLEAGLGKGADALLLIVSPLPNRRSVHLLHREGLLLAALSAECHGAGARLCGIQIHTLIHVAIGMTGNGDGLLPIFDHRVNGVQQNGGTEDGAVQNGADGAVGAFPHLGQLGVLLHPLRVGRNGGALDGYAQPLGGTGGVHRHLVPGFIPMQQSQVIVLRLQVHKGQQQLLFDHPPEHPGHFVSVHLHQGRYHSNLFHCDALLYSSVLAA